MTRLWPAVLVVLGLATSCSGQGSSQVPIRGVNLGGWLVLEPWITPSLFEQFERGRLKSETGDEWSFSEKLGKKEAARQLKKHWDSWVTEDDFRKLADAGINHVRIPIGYWALDVRPDEPWVQGQLAYMRRGLGWAHSYGMKAIIDLHGVPGSQNGFDNSGKRGSANWTNSTSNISRSLKVLRQLAHEFGSGQYANVVAGIELVNEPANWVLDMNRVRKFYEDGIGVVRAQFESTRKHSQTSGNNEQDNADGEEEEEKVTAAEEEEEEEEGGEDSDRYGRSSQHNSEEEETRQVPEQQQQIFLSDAFLPLQNWVDFMKRHQQDNSVIDMHHYHVFIDDILGLDRNGHARLACKKRDEIMAVASKFSTLVGEWSLATTDCAKWLNGFHIGARWDGTFPARNGKPIRKGATCKHENDLSSFSPDYRRWLRRFAELQMNAFEASRGWFFWNFKAEQAPQWDYLLGVEQGWIPREPQKREHHC